MKRLIQFLLIAIITAFSGTSFAYEIQLSANIPLPDNLASIAVNTTSGIAAAVSSETKTLYLIDTNSASLIKKIPLDITPVAVVIDERRNAVIISSKGGTLQFFDLDSSILLETISINSHPDASKCSSEAELDAASAIAVGPTGSLLYIGGNTCLKMIDIETQTVMKETVLPDELIGMDIDDNSGNLILIMKGREELAVYDLETLEYTGEIKVNLSPSGISVNPMTHIAVLTNRSDSSLSIIYLPSGIGSSESEVVVEQTVSFLEKPYAVAIDPTKNIALVTHKDGIALVKLENPLPTIESLIPETSEAGSAGFTLSIQGERFIRDSRARFNLKELETFFESSRNLRALVPSEELLSAGDVPVTVWNPRPGGGESNSLLFRIFNPVPHIESITPDTIAATSAPTDIRVRGLNFLPNSVINLNGKNLKTRFISSILLEARLDLTDIKTPARYPVTVINPSPLSLASNVSFLNVVEDESLISTLASAAEKEKAATETPKDTGTLTGRILNTEKKPIEGVTVQIKNIKFETDAQGYFTMNDVPSGKQHLMIHGSTAKEPDSHYPTIPLTINIEADKINNMPFQIYLHRQKNYNFMEIDPGEDTVLTDPEYPGFELRIPKGVKITGWDGQPNKKISVRMVPPDRLPVKPLPDNAYVRSVYMFYFDKVGGGVPDQPIPIKSPNDLNLLPGEKAVLWYYDESPTEGEAPNDWAIAGTGTVTSDGMYIVSDPGVGIPKFCCGATAWGGSGGGPAGGGDDGCKNGCCGTGGGGGGGGGGGFGGGGFGGGNDGPRISGTAGDPVDLATGYFIHAKTDLYIPGPIPVYFARYYRSGDTNMGAFGKGAYFEYDWWLGNYGDMLLLVKPGNYQYRFVKQADGSYINTTDPDFSGAVVWVVNNNPAEGWALIMKTGRTYQFDGWGRLIWLYDSNGSLYFERHSDFEGGYLKKISSSGGTITLNQSYVGTEPTGFFRTNEIVDDKGRRVTYTYEPDPFSQFTRLKTVTYPDGSSILYEYDSAGRMSGIINEKGVREVFNEYDSGNRVVRQTHSDGGMYTFDYSFAGGYIVATTMNLPNGGRTMWSFNNYGYITGISRVELTPDYQLFGRPTTYEREPGTNRILSVTDPLLRKMTYTYDSKGNVLTLTDNAGNVTIYEYDYAVNKVKKITDAMGNITMMTYEGGNMATLTQPDGKTTTFTYGCGGKPLTVADAIRNVTTMEYDGKCNLTKVTDSLGNFSTMTYDSLGRLKTMTDANGKTTSYFYDVMGRISSVTDPLGSTTRYSYDIAGKLMQVTDAKNQIIKYDYDDRNRLIKMTDQLGNIETYTYDTNDNLTSVTDRKGQVTTYTYFDHMNRVTRIDYSDGSYTTYTYDEVGKVLSITDSVSGTISYTYTGTGCGTGCGAVPDKVASETTPLGTINYTYDAIGRRTSMTVAGQPTVNYGYDAGGRLNDISTMINGVTKHFTIAYDGLGRRSSLTLPNGVTTNYSYDNASRLLTFQHLNPASQVLESLTYTYDAGGNRISMDRPSVSRSLPNPVSVTSYNNANQMLTFNEKNITYDANGNMTSVTNACGTTNYTWNARNQLIAIQGFNADCSTLTASFKYDALGRRIEKAINGRTIQYLYDGLDIAQEIENGQVTVNCIRTLNIDEPLARIEASGTVRYYQTDALGSVIALTDETGTVRTQYSYDPFGNVTISGEASDNPFQYTGRENDGTGLYYYRARYYSPELQRFISEDPSGLLGGINKYVYTTNNPIKYTDPRGLDRYSPCEGHGCIFKWICKKYVDVSCSGPKEEVCCKAEQVECHNKIDENDPEAEKKHLVCDIIYTTCKTHAGASK